MGFLIDEKQFINDNIIQFEDRLNSQYSRFLDKNPTFVTYYHINNIESITDTGLNNIEQIIGPNSPLKFQKISDFPVYGVESILLDLVEDDEGLTSSYDGELIILPNTIKPLPGDFFTIDYLGRQFLFMVNEVKYDTIKSNNYYKISFHIDSLEEDITDNLEKQIQEKYNCVFRNIGTQEKCLILEDDVEKLQKLNNIYKLIVDKYKVLFFNKRYNSFIFEDVENNIKIYDKFLTEFIIRNKLFQEKYNYNTLFLVNEDSSNRLPVEYENSVYRNIEKNKKELINNVTYGYSIIKNVDSVFNLYNDVYIRGINFVNNDFDYINPSLIEQIQTLEKSEDNNVVYNTIIDHFNNRLDSIYTFDLDELDDVMYINYDFETFILIPILLYIIKLYVNKFMIQN